MAYTLEALIARQPVAVALAQALGAFAVPLEQDVAVVPLPSGLTPDAERLAAQASRQEPVVYAEAEFFGGVGEQRAVLWRGGEGTVLDQGTVLDAEPGPINAALRGLGVRRSADVDEFDSVGLGRHRSTQEWVVDR
jgi:hypothetical protein